MAREGLSLREIERSATDVEAAQGKA